MRAAMTHLVRPDKIASAASELLGAPTTILESDIRPFSVTEIPADALGVVLSPAHAAGMSRGVLIDMEPALASTVVTRALRQRAPRVVDASRAPRPQLAGALAAVVHTVARRAHAGEALRVVAAGPAQALARDLAGTHHHSIVTGWFSVIVGDDSFGARVSVPLSEIPAHPERPLSVNTLLALDELPLSIPLVIATCVIGRTELEHLRVGDALMLEGITISANGRVVGEVSLIPARGELGLSGVLEDQNGVLRTDGRVSRHPWDRLVDAALSKSEPVVPSSPDQPESRAPSVAASNANPTLEVLDDVPIVVRVELGAVEMKAREWAELSAGDVIPLGRKLGDPAILRVSGVEVARGELVQVDGEYGVRILAAVVSERRGDE